ncbi:melatonin receptor type 1B-B-like isoform X1 [Apostichopus japonicus]|uniref:melatonin receptor type 1B-B-like isoform X1 n=1 Tax=Stichopus japonicus TaxID=307972 RepID=UPI003AB5BB3F
MAMNETSCDGDECWEFTDYGQRILIGCLLILISMSGVFGNALVIFSVYVSRKLRNATNVFVVNLAIADLVSCLGIVSNIIALLSRNGWPFANWICAVSATTLMTCVGVSLYTLGVISINRFVLITKTIADYQKIFGSKRNIIIWLSFIWIIPVCVVNVPLIIGLGEVGYNQKYHSCSDLSNTEYEHLYDIIIGLGLFPIPLITVIVCYIRIYAHVIKHAQKLATREDSEVVSTPANTQSVKNDENGVHSTSSNGNNVSSSIPSVSASAKRATFASQRSTTASGRRVMRRHRSIKTYLSKRQIEITKNLFYVLCAFLICISPYLFVLLLDDKQGAQFVPYAATILMFNSCINWVIYATKHPYFKNIFKAILLCRWKTIPEPIDSVREGRLLCMKRR